MHDFGSDARLITAMRCAEFVHCPHPLRRELLLDHCTSQSFFSTVKFFFKWMGGRTTADEFRGVARAFAQ